MRRTRTPQPVSHSTAGQTSCCVSVKLGYGGVSGGGSDHWQSFTGCHDVCLLSQSWLIDIFIFPVAFRLYDLDRDDKISRDELLQVSRQFCHVDKTSLYGSWRLNQPVVSFLTRLYFPLLSPITCNLYLLPSHITFWTKKQTFLSHIQV